MTSLLALLLLGVVPMAVYTAATSRLDRYQRQPWWLPALFFLWGAGPAALLAYLGQTATRPHVPRLAVRFVVAGPLIEEAAKALPLLLLLLCHRRAIDSALDGLLLGAAAGFGFNATENVLYFQDALHTGGRKVLALSFLGREVFFGFGHAFYAAVAGAGVALARHARGRAGRLLAAPALFALAVACHGLFNLGVLQGERHWFARSLLFIDWLLAFALLAAVEGALRLERRWIVGALREEVSGGRLTAFEVRLLASPARRAARHLRALLRGGRAAARALDGFLRTATALAFEKRHARELDEDDEGAGGRIAGLRRLLAERREVALRFACL
jgi:RsiW-degrading membrane proteinase PrsW (M82 family)